MQDLNPVFYVIILIMSVVIHEIAHGYAALRFGDTTAKYQGRLTLNPLKHLDMFGSVILPLVLIITRAPFLIGWANLFGIVVRAGIYLGLPDEVVTLSGAIVLLNVVLAIFNLVPIPPLDGSKILFSAIGYRSVRFEAWFERYSIFVLLFFIFFLWDFLVPAVFFIFRLITGLS